MPIRFRCAYCNRLLGIATRKAGTETTCPHCGYAITVPHPDGEARAGRVNVDDVSELLRQPAALGALEPEDAGEITQKSLTLVAPVTKPRAAPPTRATGTESAPLFEGDLDALLGTSDAPVALDKLSDAKPSAASGTDARSLGDPKQHIVLSSRAATLLMALVVAALALAFALGYYVAPRVR